MFRTLWRLRQEAFTTHDRSFLAAFETGPALEADETTCGCVHRDPRGPIVTDSVLVPRTSHLPATFLGEATTTLDGSPYQQWLIIERTSSTTPWVVVADPGDTNVWGLDEGSASPKGFDLERPPGPSSRSLPSKLAAYYQSWTNSGHAPAATGFRPGPWTTATGAQLLQNPQGATSSRTGLEYHYRYQAGSPRDFWSFGTTTGGLVCGVVYEQDTSTAPSGGVLQDPSQNNFGPTVAPGIYAKIVTTYIAQPCFLEQPGGGVQVVSGIMDDDTEQAFDPLSAP